MILNPSILLEEPADIHNDSHITLRMVGKTRRFEILLGFTILINVSVLLVVLNTQKNEMASELKSKAQLLGRLNELQKVLHSHQNPPIRINIEQHEGEANEKSNGDIWNNLEGNNWKSPNNIEISSKKPVLHEYCPEGGANLGNIDSFFFTMH